MKTNWHLQWDDKEEYIIAQEIDEDTKELIKTIEFCPPSHANLYYALKDWFGDL